MATVLRLQPRAKVEDASVFSAHTGNVYVEVLSDETKTFAHWRIYATAPTEANFNAAPISSELNNIADGTKKRKTAATTWAVSDQT